MVKIGVVLVVFVAVSLTAFLVGSAGSATSRKQVPIKGHSRAKVKAGCNGVSWSDSVTYGCINKDGSGIVCSGVTESQKKTCSIFRKAPQGAYSRELLVAVSRAHP